MSKSLNPPYRTVYQVDIINYCFGFWLTSPSSENVSYIGGNTRNFGWHIVWVWHIFRRICQRKSQKVDILRNTSTESLRICSSGLAPYFYSMNCNDLLFIIHLRMNVEPESLGVIKWRSLTLFWALSNFKFHSFSRYWKLFCCFLSLFNNFKNVWGSIGWPDWRSNISKNNNSCAMGWYPITHQVGINSILSNWMEKLVATKSRKI